MDLVAYRVNDFTTSIRTYPYPVRMYTVWYSNGGQRVALVECIFTNGGYTVWDISIVINDLQCWKAQAFIVVTLSGIVIVINDVQPAKA